MNAIYAGITQKGKRFKPKIIPFIGETLAMMTGVFRPL